LILDGKIQSSEKDEFIYHEALVHPAMIAHPQPETIFIAGGGEGATLREILAHKTVKKVVMVDIDEEVIDICQKFLPSFHQSSFSDERVKLHLSDAKKYLDETEEKFDVIIIDLPEPVEEGPAYFLYTKEFYKLVGSKLANGGIISVQSGSADFGNLLNFIAVVNTLRSVFPIISPYWTNVPSFGGCWGFTLASQEISLASLGVKEIDARIPGRITKTLKFYNGIAHRGMFSLPKYFHDEMEKERRVITESEPFFIQ
jgi:spermidine synthase